MKRFIVFLLLCMTGCSFALGEAVNSYDAMPPIFAVEVESVQREIEDNRAFVYKEYLHTTNEAVNARLCALADEYDARLAPLLEPDPKKKGHLNSRLNVDMVYYRTGERWISTMMLADVTWYRERRRLEMTTGTYDLVTGERVSLGDLFAEESPAWELLRQGVREHLQSVFPEEGRDSEAIEALCVPEALAQADFTLSGMELTLHYPASAVLYGEKSQLIHARFFYPQFEGMMTPLGMAVTDNSRWKMVVITCDDGPKENTSTYALNAFRKAGARVTYFHVGTQMERHPDVLRRQFDQNHILGNHSYHHWSGYSFKSTDSKLRELSLNDALTLAIVGETASFFRAPGGTYPPWAEAELPVPIIQWTLDTYDYTGKSAKKIFYSVRNNVREYDIILCHDTGKYLHAAVPIFGEYLTAHGYMMVTLQELASAQGMTPQPNGVYLSFREGEQR